MLALPHLPKLLLQTEDSPLVAGALDVALAAAAADARVHCCLHPRGDAVAIALDQRLVTVHGIDPTGMENDGALEFATVLEAPERVAALAWLVSPSQPADECLALATTAGYLQLHAPDGELILRQELHDGPAASLALKRAGGGLDPGDRAEDLTVGFRDGAVVRIPCWEAWAAARWHAGRRGRQRSSGGGWWGGGGGGGDTPPHLSFDKWQLPKSTGPRSYAVCLGTAQPPLYALLSGRPPAPQLFILTTGAAPAPLASCQVEEGAGPGLLSRASDLARATASSLLGSARSYLPFSSSRRAAAAAAAAPQQQHKGGGGGAGAGASGGEARPRKREKIPGQPAAVAAAVWDEKRAVRHTALSPCGRWAACCDSLGRVLLVDTAGTTVLRMFKGYRGAQAAWLAAHGRPPPAPAAAAGPGRPASTAAIGGSVPPSASATSISSSSEGWAGDETAIDALLAQQEADAEEGGGSRPPSSSGGGNGEAQPAEGHGDTSTPAEVERQQQQQEPASEQLYLVIFAPRRGVMELWQPHAGRRVGSLRCDTQAALLVQQPAPRVAASSGSGASAVASRRGSASRCWLLDLQALLLTDVTPRLTALLA